VYGTWVALYGIAGAFFTLLGVGPSVLAVLAGLYLLAIAWNVPLRVWLATVLFVGLVLASSLPLLELASGSVLTALLVAVCAALIPLCYKLQAWSHTVWNIENDMTEFNAKYHKGKYLFVVLTVYEPAILLNYLVFDRKHWA
jgi:hypothetical protein